MSRSTGTTTTISSAWCERVERRGAVGQSASAVLAVAGAVRHRLDGRASRRAVPDRRLWRVAADAGDRLVHDAERADPRATAAPGRRWRRPWGPTSRASCRRRCICSAWRWRFVDPRLADALYTLVALMWLVPDRRMEKAVRGGRGATGGGRRFCIRNGGRALSPSRDNEAGQSSHTLSEGGLARGGRDAQKDLEFTPP